MTLNDVDRAPGVRNATILMILGGAIQIYSGYQLFQLSLIYSGTLSAIVGTLMVIFGLLSLSTSLLIWQQKPWVTKIVAGIGVAVCGSLIILGYHLVVFFFAPLYWAVIDYIRNSRVIEHSNWDDC